MDLRAVIAIAAVFSACANRPLENGSVANSSMPDASPSDSSMPDLSMPDFARPDLSTGPAQCASLGGLLAYYPLDTNTNDYSGNGNHALGAGLMPTAGKIGNALTFDGTSSSLHATGTATLAGARTLCAWVMPRPNGGLGQPVFSGGRVNAGDFFSISASNVFGGTCPFLPPSVPFVDHWGSPTCYYDPSFTLSQSWHFVCYVFDGQGIELYADGKSASVGSSEYSYALDTLYIGSTVIGGTTTNASLAGTIDEVTVWSRALDASELAILWNGGVGCAAR
jgi:hypothetical protein